MQRQRALLIASLGLVLAAVLAVLALDRPFHRSPVYSVADVRSHLAQDPRRWLGRTLLVRGEANVSGCREAAATLVLCAPLRAYLTDPSPAPAVAVLPLVAARPDPLLTLVRHLPLVGSVAAPPQVVHWGLAAVYRVQLRMLAATSGGRAYAAVLLDAAPDSR
jgi:hypothetical protein